jgi:hypothetical protein
MIRNDRGYVLVEFLLIFVPFLLFIMGTMQLLLLHVAKMGATHAANAAARAAVVVLDDRPNLYGNEPRNQAPPGSVRFNAIEESAQIAAAPLRMEAAFDGPEPSSSPHAALTPDPAQRRLVSVSFPDNPGGSFGKREDVKVKVEVRMPCFMPFVDRILCEDGERVIFAESQLPNQGANYRYKD